MKKLVSFILLLLLVCGSAMAATTLDGGADQASAAAIAVGGSYLDTVEPAAQEWFAFTADQDSAYYRIDVKNEDANAWMNVAVFDEQGVKLFGNDVYSGNSLFFSWKATPGAKYAVCCWFNGDKDTGKMTLSLVKTPDAHGNDLPESSTLETNAEVVSTFDGTGDVDCFTFTTAEGSNFYNVDIRNNDLDAWLNYELLDANGLTVLKSDVYRDNTASMNWKAEPNAQYFVKLYSGDNKACGKYTVKLSSVADNEPDAMEASVVLVEDQKTEGAFNGTGDVDCFTFTTAEGSNFYNVDIRNNDLDAWLNYELLDANGLIVLKNDGYGDNTPSVSWKAEPNAQYFVKLYSGDNKARGKYTLTLSHAADNEPDAMEAGVALVEGQKTEGAFNGMADQDYFTFTTAEGSNFYRVDIKNETLDAWMNYEVLDANGLSVQRDGVYKDGTASVSWKAEPNTQYYVKLNSGDERRYGKYTLTLSHAADNEPDTMENAAALALGDTSASFDGTGDEDYFTFTAGAERAYYRLVLKNATTDTTVYMELQDRSGLKVETLEASKGRNDVYSFAAEPGAVYYLKLTRYDNRKQGDYVITAEEYLDPMGDTPETALKLEDGVKAEGTIAGKEDVDFLAVTTGDMALIRLAVENAAGNERMNVAVLDNSGKEVTSWRVDGGTTGEKTLELAPNATYYVRVKCDQAGKFTALYETLADLGGSSIQSAVALQAGEKADLFFEMKMDTDYVAFPEAGAAIRVMATGEKNVTVYIVDENGMTLQNETRIYAGNSRVYVAERSGAYLKILGDGGAYCVQCCTESQHVSSEYFETVKEPTCSVEGLKEMYCVVCEAVVATESIACKAHTPAESFRVVKYASCDDTGLQEKKCIRCGEIVEQEEIPATGHQNSRWEILLKDTCTENGIQRRVCTDCGKQLEQEIITALGHVEGDWEVKKHPTCTESGHQVRECRVCYQVLEEQFAPAVGHQYGEWTVVKEPTSAEEGLQQQVCKNCGDTQSQTIEKKSFFDGLFGK